MPRAGRCLGGQESGAHVTSVDHSSRQITQACVSLLEAFHHNHLSTAYRAEERQARGAAVSPVQSEFWSGVVVVAGLRNWNVILTPDQQ